MDERLSRPARWNSAIKRANRALKDLDCARDQLIEVFEKLQDEWDTACKEFDDAVGELISLQSEYSAWQVPENLWDSRVQEKLNKVQDLDFKSLKELRPLAKLRTPLGRF
jgi:hypothetical protein